MNSPRKFPASIAQAVAQKIVDALVPACLRVAIAGSLRRGKETVHDIDIVLLPKPGVSNDFGSCQSLLEHIFHDLVERGSLTPVRDGDKIKGFVATKTGIPVDIYIANEDTWATLLLIRTGSKDHNVRLAQRARELGMKLRASGDGIEGLRGELVKMRTEEEIFSLLKLPYLSPKERD